MRQSPAFFLLLLAAACRSSSPPGSHAQTGGPAADSATIHRIVDSLDGVFRSAWERKDVDAVASLYAGDVFTIRDGQISRGREGLRAALAKAMPALKRIDFKPIAFYASGDLAVESAEYTQYWQPANKPSFQVSGVYTDVFRRQPDGSFKTQVFISTKKP